MGERRHKFRRDKKRVFEDVEEDDSDSAVFGDERWSDSRFFFGKNGHTLRRNACSILIPHKAATLERKGGRKCLEATQPAPTTDIDHFFDAGFCSRMFDKAQCRPLNNADVFDSVVESLEELAVHKSVKYDRFKGEEEYIYDVPISGHIITEFVRLKDPGFLGSDVKRKLTNKVQEKCKRDITRWPFLFDKFWDPGFLYLIDPRLFSCAEYYAPSMITPLIPIHDSDAHAARTQLGLVDSDKERIAVQSYSEVSAKRHSRYHRNYLEIDLGHFHEITHIGTLGGYPDWRKIQQFPRSLDPVDTNPFKFKKHWRRCNYLHTVRANGLGWITEYSVQYRHPVSRKWCDYHQHFSGNTNVCDEVVHNVSLQARYLRIIPRTHHQYLEYTALIYGRRLEEQNPRDRKKGKAAKHRLLQMDTDETESTQRSDKRHRDEVDAQKVETVRYTLCRNEFRRHCLDGACCSCQRRDYYGADSPWQIRDLRRRVLKEDLDNWRES